MPIRIAINGFGRIGRVTCRALQGVKGIDLVAINDLTDKNTLAHLLKYDSVHRAFPGSIGIDEQGIVINGKPVMVFSEKNPEQLPWSKLGIDIVIESTGRYTDKEGASLHLKAGAKKVIISAPTSSPEGVKSVVLGVNEQVLSSSDQVISNASCTTNNAAPMLKVLNDNWGIESAYITTIHSYTGDQNIHDAPHKDLRRARAAAVSIIPTTTGAAKALTEIFPDMKGKLGGAGVRVPVPDGSLTDITCKLSKIVSVEEINLAFEKAANSTLKGILEYTSDPIVSIDIVGNTHSCIFDAGLTSVLGSMVKVVGWYDNETGYSNRLVDLILKIS